MCSGFYNFSNLTQTIKGRIVDVDTEIPLPRAAVVILGTDPLIGASADIDGYCRLDRNKLGRYNLIKCI